jgi:hypothetical protein
MPGGGVFLAVKEICWGVWWLKKICWEGLAVKKYIRGVSGRGSGKIQICQGGPEKVPVPP